MKQTLSMPSTKSDISAGLVVFLVALPLCLGVALASTGDNSYLFSGIIAGIVGGILVSLFSNSAIGVSGPAAGLVVIVFSGIQTLGSFPGFLTALVLAGAIQLIMGYVKAGVIAYFFPSSVIKGMLAAIGLILIFKQLPLAFGISGVSIDDSVEGDNIFKILDFARNIIQQVHYGSLITTVVGLVLLILLERPGLKKYTILKVLPPALWVVFLGIALNALYKSVFPQLEMSGVQLVNLPIAGSFGEFFNFFYLPDFSILLSNPQVYIIAITIAMVASLETLLCVEATDKLDPYKRYTSANKELRAQGIGNIVSGLIGGLPITQVIVRSSVNVDAGGRTKIASITHGIIMLICVITIPSFLNLIPLPTLAAILILVGYKLSKISLYKAMYKLKGEQFLPFIVTIVGVVGFDMLKGIALGMMVGIYFILRKNYKNSYLSEKEDFQDKPITTICLSQQVSFLNKSSIKYALEEIPEHTKVIIDGRSSSYIDYDVLESIYEFKKYTAPYKNIEVETYGIPQIEYTRSH
ncbi:MAG: SulP family inorganic anion transporter [Chitinophagaceae bacterium]